ncbi:hypothetical protein ACRRQX_000214 [Yersinia enterocolitica]|nr:hypothetical protein [Yersinia enterocolitica]
MQAISIIPTKDDTTIAANSGSVIADVVLRVVPAAIDNICRRATGLCPQWRVRFSHFSGKISRRHSHVNRS